MVKPMVCFVTWNRLGLTIRNLTCLLESEGEFDLYIIDNNSYDGTWDYLQTVKDPRIKLKEKLEKNRGVVYAINYVLAKRKENQYFIFIENDVCIEDPMWLQKFMDVMEAFPNLGFVGGAREGLFEEKGVKPEIIYNLDRSQSYYSYPSILGCFNCYRPEIFQQLGYWNEETYGADRDMSYRTKNFTSFDTGYITTIKMNQTQKIHCDFCPRKEICPLLPRKTCFGVYKERNMHPSFKIIAHEKQCLYMQEINEGLRTPYCASIHDSKSMINHTYNWKWAEENFDFFLEYGN